MLNLLLKLKERLEFYLVEGINLMYHNYKMKSLLNEFEVYTPKPKIVHEIYLLYKDLLENESDYKSEEMLDLLSKVTFVVINLNDNDIDDNVHDIISVETKYINIPNEILEDFNAGVYTNKVGRYELLSQVLENTDILEDYRIFNGMIYALDDSFDNIRELVEQKLCLVSKEYLPYFEKVLSESNTRNKTTTYYVKKQQSLENIINYLKDLKD